MKIIFGASRKGKILIERHPEISFDCFIDNDPSKWQSTYLGLKVLNLEEILKSKSKFEVIVASQYTTQIAEQLLKNGIYRFSVFDPGYLSSDCNESQDIYEIELNEIDRKKTTSLIIHNNSGSNTLALHKSQTLIAKNIDYSAVNQNVTPKEYLETILKSKNLITTHDTDLPTNINAIQLWHGFPLKGLNYQSRHQSTEARNKARNRWLNYRAITSYSQTYSTLMNACYGIHSEKYHITGMPRNDFLFSTEGRSILEKITNTSLHSKRVIFYLPTFRKTSFGQINGEDDFNIFSENKLDRERFYKFLERHGLLLITKNHPYQSESIEYHLNGKLPDCIFSVTDKQLSEHGVDFYEVLACADLLITDYSSVYFDYLLLDRPIVFTPSDIDQYAKNRGFLVQPYDFWAPGPKCLSQSQLERQILENLDDPKKFQKERETVKNIVHHYQDDGSCSRTAELIARLIE